jgi:hypothetical protein
MAAKSKYKLALEAFIAAKAKLYNPASTAVEYANAVEESDAAWRLLFDAANAVEAEA